ncbi:ATP binding protein [[Candida] boidinii]|nr:ATP binding protein [[Candida] boidinii]OWB60593.1 ATP binding protein [[Candida] boidinii]OWB71998.1 ATP binding protein [[Candida] boidinii]
MFKKKEKPLTLMLEIYNEIANNSLLNLSNEQNGNLNLALQGWINLYNYSNDKLIILNKKIENLNLTQEESYLFDEINILKSQSDDHLVRLNIKIESLKSNNNSNNSTNTITPATTSDNVHKKKSSVSTTTTTPSSLNVPTLRKPVPQLMNTTSKQKPLLKSLRNGNGNTINSSSQNLSSSQQIPSSSSSSSSTSTSANTQYLSTSPTKTQQSQITARQAANLIWAPSTSLSKQKSYTKQHTSDTSLFQDFDSDLSSPILQSSSAFQNNNNNKSNSRPNSPSTSNDTLTPELADELYLSNLKNLRGQGISAKSNRNNHIDENDLNKLAFAISELNSRDQQQQQQQHHHQKVNTIHTNQKQINNHIVVPPQSSSKPITRSLTPSERAKLALKKSAAVKLSRRSASSPNSSSSSTTQQASRTHHHNHTASNPNVTAKLSKSSTTQHVIYTNSTQNGSNIVKRSTSPVKQQQQQQQQQRSTTTTTTRPKIPPLNPLSNNNNSSKDTINSESSLKDTETLDSDEEQHTHDLAIEGDEKAEDKLISSLKGVDPIAAKQILKEIVIKGDEVYWDDIAGLEVAKNSLKETVVYPFLRPDLFSGLREPARGMLLFGPPGTGKTMLARAVATESKSTFFSISASSLTSKYLGESEKLVRALFQLAKKLAPSIIFVDEIDSLLGSRSNENENESSRRIKNEFLVQWSDLTKAAAGRDQGEDLQRVLVLAATNLPWSIDEAARRRFVRRQYIPLPELETRKYQLLKLLSHQNHNLNESDMVKLIEITDGFSGSDITALAKDAAMGPLRELGEKLLLTSKSEIRPVELKDFINSLNYIRPSVSKESLKEFENWAKIFGSSGV